MLLRNANRVPNLVTCILLAGLVLAIFWPARQRASLRVYHNLLSGDDVFSFPLTNLITITPKVEGIPDNATNAWMRISVPEELFPDVGRHEWQISELSMSRRVNFVTSECRFVSFEKAEGGAGFCHEYPPFSIRTKTYPVLGLLLEAVAGTNLLASARVHFITTPSATNLGHAKGKQSEKLLRPFARDAYTPTSLFLGTWEPGQGPPAASDGLSVFCGLPALF